MADEKEKLPSVEETNKALVAKVMELEDQLETLAQEEENKPEVVFTSDMEMVMVDRYKARFRVVNKEGLNVLNLAHLEVDRKEFPSTDNFNMDFITSDLEQASMPTVTTAGKDQDQVKAEKGKIKKAHNKLKQEQEKYREYTLYRLTIEKVV